jgi:hypothetical protein
MTPAVQRQRQQFEALRTAFRRGLFGACLELAADPTAIRLRIAQAEAEKLNALVRYLNPMEFPS